MKKKSSLFQLPFRKISLSGLFLTLFFFLFTIGADLQFSTALKIPTSDSSVELYSNQTDDNLTDLFTQAIEQTKESITLVIYALTDYEIIQALNKKCKEGIPVYIVCDAKASPGISRRIPDATIIKRFGEGLMHQKILIIDRRQIWMGSANFTMSSLGVHGNLVIGLDHPALAEVLISRSLSMDEEGAVTAPILHCCTRAGSQNLELWVLPDDPTAVDRVIQLIRSAEKSIKVAMFTWTRVDFAKEIIDAAKRGIDVEVVIDRNSGKGASSKIVKMLDEAGVCVHLSTCKGLLHHKFAYIDNTLVNGSANWTQAAFKTNDDYFLIIDSLTDEQKVKMGQLWERIRQESNKPQFSKKTLKKGPDMKIALLGYGKMGKLIEKLAHEKGHQTIARFSKSFGILDLQSPQLSQADVAIDFSDSSAVINHVHCCVEKKIPLVIGTTGWTDQLEAAKKLVQEKDGSCLFAPNFSIGIYLFQQILHYAASLFQNQPDFHVKGVETHHHQKKDIPSGTALSLSKIISDQMPRINNFHFSSLREGDNPGNHSIIFESNHESISFIHQANNREGFASGALFAAEWLVSRRGFFTLPDLFEESFS